MKHETVAIEKGVPLPNQGGARSVLGKLFEKMKVGESFVTQRQLSSIYSLARYYDVEVAIRSIGDGTVRVWRIK